MHILYIQPGSGGSFYCQNCLRDLSVCDALRAAGHEVTMLPLYLPATAHAPAPEEVPVFYSAVTLYLRHRYRWMQRLPRRWFRPLDSWPVLKLAARFAGSTSADGLEEMTLSMLRGMEGRQAEELTMLAEWVEAVPREERPEVIVLSNALLAGLAERLKQAADGCPVLCWLQDEHVWTDAMHASLRTAVVRAMRDDARHIDRFIAVSAYYRDLMAKLLNISAERIDVIYPSLNAENYRRADMRAAPRRVGFLSRLSASEGFDVFVDAFIELRRDPQFSDVRAAATGGPAPDKKFLQRQLKKLEAAGLAGDAEIQPARFADDRRGFLAGLTLLSVPGGATPEAFGYYAIEAMAAGVPVVLPAQGAFPEFVGEDTGGVLVGELSPRTLAAAWAELLANPGKLDLLSANAVECAQTRFSGRQMMERWMHST
jgi:glycosyltransferase involved in cell wall biosynthesis